jgi:uncharacterized protein YjeT (DUF2065 family)
VGDLWAALCLVLVIEGLLLFAMPAAWKEAVTWILAQPQARLRAAGATMVVVGLAALWLLRAG